MTNAVNLASAAGTGFAFRNKLINGNFDVWQRGTSGFSTATGTYTADRWRNDQTITVVRSTDVPNSGALYSFDVTQGSTSYGTFVQRIESANCFDLVGKQITLSFWAKNVSGSIGMNVLIRYAGSTDNFSSPVNIQSIGSSISSSWTYYTFTFNALPSQVANGLEVGIYRDLGSAQTRYSQIQLEVGSVATPFERRLYTTELQLAQRYFERDTDTSAGFYVTQRSSISNGEWYQTVPFQIWKRAVPTITTFPYTTAANTNRWSNNVGTDFGANSAVPGGITYQRFSVQNNSGGTLTTGATIVFGRWTADAEL